MTELVRINTRIAADLNSWLDEHSAKTGMSKSVIMMIAAENYRKEHQAFGAMEQMALVVDKLEKLESILGAAEKQ